MVKKPVTTNRFLNDDIKKNIHKTSVGISSRLGREEHALIQLHRLKKF